MWVFFLVLLIIAISFLLFFPFNYTIWNEYEYLYTGQKDGIDAKHKSNITGFISIPDTSFNIIDTPNGKVKFVQFVGVTDNELSSIINKELSVKELYNKIGTDVTSFNRESVV